MSATAYELGYWHVPAVFTPEYMAAIEAKMHVDDEETIAAFREHPAIVELAHALLGDILDDTNESVIHHNPTRIYDGWHYDIPWDSLDGGIIPAWRFALYFRDYTTHSGGISFAPCSHLGSIGAKPVFRPVMIESQPGDVVIWNLRMFHKPNTHIEGREFAVPRNAVIFDYAAPGVEVDRYKTWRKPKHSRPGKK